MLSRHGLVLPQEKRYTFMGCYNSGEIKRMASTLTFVQCSWKVLGDNDGVRG